MSFIWLRSLAFRGRPATVLQGDPYARNVTFLICSHILDHGNEHMTLFAFHAACPLLLMVSTTRKRHWLLLAFVLSSRNQASMADRVQ